MVGEGVMEDRKQKNRCAGIHLGKSCVIPSKFETECVSFITALIISTFFLDASPVLCVENGMHLGTIVDLSLVSALGIFQPRVVRSTS
jgi:hypothetical protein